MTISYGQAPLRRLASKFFLQNIFVYLLIVNLGDKMPSKVNSLIVSDCPVNYRQQRLEASDEAGRSLTQVSPVFMSRFGN